MAKRLTFTTLVLCLLATPASISPAAPEQQVVVERVHWPVMIRPDPGKPDAPEICTGIGPADIEFTWKGERLEVTAMGPRPLPRLHALLIDSSNSMNQRLRTGTRFEEAQKAALEYIDATPDGDLLLVASFDESLVLGTPPTADKERARAAILKMKTGYTTALWDSLGYLISYLDTLHGEKALILLSDGVDEGSYRWRSYEEVLALAVRSRNLALFPIGLRLSEATADFSRQRLGLLASRTGGEFFETRGEERLGWMFRKVLARLEDKLYIALKPPAPSVGSSRARSAASARGGKVKIRLRKDLPCRITSLGSPEWLSSWLRGSAEVKIASLDEKSLMGFEEGLACMFPDSQQQVVRVMVAGKSPTTEDEGQRTPVLAQLQSGEALLGRIEDILVGRGPLFNRKAYERKGELRVRMMREAVFESRDIAIPTPPLSVVQSRLTDPESLLLFLLEAGLCAPEPSEAVRAPFLVHGRTFLELRDLLGHALFVSRSDYASWAARMVETEVESELQGILGSWPEDTAPSDAEIAQLRRAMIKQASDLPKGHANRYLVGWLGDLPVAEVAEALEARLIEELLAAPEGSAGKSPATEAAVASWHRLSRWFPPAMEVRTVTPLVPAFDPELDLIGFYRFILPRPRPGGRQPRPLADHPLALLTVRRLLRDPEARSMLAGHVRVISVSYDELPDKGERVEVLLGRSLGAKTGLLKIVACCAEPSHDVLDIDVEMSGAGQDDTRQTTRRLQITPGG